MIKTGIVGASGYSGVELLRLLAGHPKVELHAVTSRSHAGKEPSELFSNLRGCPMPRFTMPEQAPLDACDVVFFATPNGTAMHQVPTLLAAGVRVIDLSADFRLQDAGEWSRWYKLEHACPELLADAVYGLPEYNRATIRQARLVANPGCYATAVQIGLLPLVAAGVIDPRRVIADCKSGASGAGRKAELGLLLAEAGDNFRAYNVAGHRHLPEITASLQAATGHTVSLTFVPHLVPMLRGIHATLYAHLTDPGVDLQRLFESRYGDEPFVDVLAPGSHPETRSVRGSNHCRLAVHRPQGGDTVVVLVVEDNLVKGAAGQAVQNMNLMFGLPENCGLGALALLP